MSSARPPPSNSTASPSTRRTTASGGKKSPTGDPSVESGALLEHPAQRFDQRAEGGFVHALTVRRAGCPGDVLVDQGAAKVVAPGLQELDHTGQPHPHP